MKIAIDFGHGCGQDRGADGILNEEHVIREYGPIVISELQQLGHNVINVTPDPGLDLSLEQSLAYRVNTANRANVDLFVSLHVNCYNGEAHGCEVEYISNSGKKYADRICSNLSALGYTNRGAQLRNNLYVLKYTNSPAFLVEVFFCDNKNDCDKYNTTSIANAIVKGITGQVIEPKKEEILVKNLVVYNEGADKRAAEYLADGIQSPICCLSNLTQDTINAVENIYMVGGSTKPCEKAVLVAGSDRFATVKAVLTKLGK